MSCCIREVQPPDEQDAKWLYQALDVGGKVKQQQSAFIREHRVRIYVKHVAASEHGDVIFYLNVYDLFPLFSSLCAFGGAGKSP